MKSLLIALLTALSPGLFAQSKALVEKAPQNYLVALKSDNNGLSESAIFQVVKYQMFYPDQYNYKIVGQLIRLANNSRSAVIREKARLAVAYIQHAEWLSKVEKKDYKNGDEFFTLLRDRNAANK